MATKKITTTEEYMAGQWIPTVRSIEEYVEEDEDETVACCDEPTVLLQRSETEMLLVQIENHLETALDYVDQNMLYCAVDWVRKAYEAIGRYYGDKEAAANVALRTTDLARCNHPACSCESVGVRCFP